MSQSYKAGLAITASIDGQEKVAALSKELDGLASATDRAEEAAKGAKEQVGALGGESEILSTKLTGVAGAVAGAFALDQVLGFAAALAPIADAAKNLEGRMRLAVGETGNLEAALEEVRSSANATGSDINAVGDLFGSLARSTQSLGASQAEVATLTDTINKSFAISNTSAAAASGAITQLSQAFATVVPGSVYVVSQDNQIYALNTATGQTQWNGIGAVELAGVFGAAAPAFAQSTIVAGFSSGELTAYRYENGQVVWQDALARTGISTIVGNLSDIDADPVIDNGRVFAVGQGGRMVAVELVSGQRAWEINIAGISTPWVSGEWVFVVTDRAELLAVARSSGRIRWKSQLQRFRSPERRSAPDRIGNIRVTPGTGPIFWRGPILAGGNLVLASSTGQIVLINPADGAVRGTIAHTTPVSLPPVVANGVMYILDDNGMLTAYR